jgi:hypothetical protein
MIPGIKRNSQSGTLGTTPMAIPPSLVCVVYQPVGAVTITAAYRNGSPSLVLNLSGYGPASTVPLDARAFAYVYQSAGAGSVSFVMLPPALVSSLTLDSVQPQLLYTTTVIATGLVNIPTTSGNLIVYTVPVGMKALLLRAGFVVNPSINTATSTAYLAAAGASFGIDTIGLLGFSQVNPTGVNYPNSGGPGQTTTVTGGAPGYQPWPGPVPLGAGDVVYFVWANFGTLSKGQYTITLVLLLSQASE